MPKANMNRKITTEEKKLVIELYKDGKLPSVIGKELRMYHKVIVGILHENGLHIYQDMIPEDLKEKIINDYVVSGHNATDISDRYIIKRDAIVYLLRKNNLYKGDPRSYSDDDIKFLLEHYPTDSWDSLLTHFPNKNKQNIQSIASTLGIKRVVGVPKVWSSEEIEELKNVWGAGLSKIELEHLFNRTYDAISTKAYKLKLTTPRTWTKKEDSIIIENYNKIPIDKIVNLLPNRTEYGIKVRARKLGIYSYLYDPWTEWENETLKENWKLLPDCRLAELIGRSRQSVKERRHYYGFYRQDPNNKSYPTLSKYIRGQIWDWKLKSMESCQWKCVFTGSKDFEIHHLYGVSNILSDIISKHHIQEKQIEEYTQEELDNITQLFIKEQAKYPLGVCVKKDIHVLFHRLYGQYYNTPEQWYQFEIDYKNGVYDTLINKNEKIA